MRTARLRTLGLAGLCLAALSCASRRAEVCVPPAPTLAPPMATSQASPSAPADLAAPQPGPEAESEALRYLPGEDRPSAPLVRRATAVLLFAPPSQPPDPKGLERIETLRFQPLICSADGKLLVGARCGELMPARVRVRLTAAGDRVGEDLELSRSTLPFRDTAGEKTYPAPYGPACCMYNTCVGKTVPYYPLASDRGSAWFSTRTVLAVWPADADIKLTPLTPESMSDPELENAPALRAVIKGATPGSIQAAQLGSHGYVALQGGKSGPGGHLLVKSSQGVRPLFAEMGVRAYYLLSSSDLDGDGRFELVVYARWANDYSLHVLREGDERPLYGYSCGNI